MRRNHVLAVQVHPSSGRPHYLKSAGLGGGVYVRVGSTNRRADRELIDELRRFARGETSFAGQKNPRRSGVSIDKMFQLFSLFLLAHFSCDE
jgi:ATP-dependent DNA helicase RecG